MKKIVRQQNYLKGLIDAQSNRLITKQTLKNVIRAILEPLLDNPEDGVVLHRIINVKGLTGLLKRLDFSEIKAFNFSDNSTNLKELVWAETEFICVLTHRYVVVLLWDDKTSDKNYVRYYSIWNSKLQIEALDIIDRNSLVDIKPFKEKYRPDRRDNLLLNNAIRKIIENTDDAIKDAVLGYAEFQAKPVHYTLDVREVSHEIRNQLSICDLYTEIIRRYCDKNAIDDETILNGVRCISRAIKMSSNSLLSLKTTNANNIQPYQLKEIINAVVDLTKVYFECQDIDYRLDNRVNLDILCDENRLIAVLVNLVKNAIEAFGSKDLEEKEAGSKNSKYIKIITEKRGDFAAIRVINNAGKIEEPDMIFEKGFTTKASGSGLGLGICNKYIREQGGDLTLAHNAKKATEFLIKMKIVE